MNDTFTFNGTSSSAYGTYLADYNQFDGPQRDITLTDIPGRSGSIAIDNNRYNNYILTYSAYMRTASGYPNELRSNMMGLKQLLLTGGLYKRLSDTFNTGVYRMALFQGPFTVLKSDHNSAVFSVNFQCKPQLFLTTGDDAISYTAAGTITNPTDFPSKPLLRIYGTGNLTIGTGVITINSSDGLYTDIDCDTMEAYYGSVSCNGNITLQGYSFPTLAPGLNNISWTGSITRVDVTPRWWIL